MIDLLHQLGVIIVFGSILVVLLISVRAWRRRRVLNALKKRLLNPWS